MGMQPIQKNSSSRVLSEINIIPLVDIMLVLLIMFMVTAPLMQSGLDVSVPEVNTRGMELPQEPFRIVITRDRKVVIAKQDIAMEGLGARLKAIFENQKNKQVFLEADSRVDYGFVAQVMSEIRNAGIYQIGLITQPVQSKANYSRCN